MVATVVLLGAVAWGFLILTADVYAPIEPENLAACGTVGMVAMDRQMEASGEIDYDQKRFEDVCTAKARRAARPVAVPLVLVMGSVVFLGAASVGVVRRSKAEGRSAGPLTR